METPYHYLIKIRNWNTWKIIFHWSLHVLNGRKISEHFSRFTWWCHFSFLTSNVTSNLHGYEVKDEPEWSFCSSVAPSRFFSVIQSAAIHSKKCQEPVGGILFPESSGSNLYSLCLHLKCLWRWRNVTSFCFSQHTLALQDWKDKSQPILLLLFDNSPLSSRFLCCSQSYVVPKEVVSCPVCVWYSSDETVGSSGITLTEELVSLCEAEGKKNRKEWLNSV